MKKWDTCSAASISLVKLSSWCLDMICTKPVSNWQVFMHSYKVLDAKKVTIKSKKTATNCYQIGLCISQLQILICFLWCIMNLAYILFVQFSPCVHPIQMDLYTFSIVCYELSVYILFCYKPLDRFTQKSLPRIVYWKECTQNCLPNSYVNILIFTVHSLFLFHFA